MLCCFWTFFLNAFSACHVHCAPRLSRVPRVLLQCELLNSQSPLWFIVSNVMQNQPNICFIREPVDFPIIRYFITSVATLCKHEITSWKVEFKTEYNNFDAVGMTFRLHVLSKETIRKRAEHVSLIWTWVILMSYPSFHCRDTNHTAQWQWNAALRERERKVKHKHWGNRAFICSQQRAPADWASNCGLSERNTLMWALPQPMAEFLTESHNPTG